jgi:hypothetical protein
MTALALVAGVTAIAQQPAGPAPRTFAPTPPSAAQAAKAASSSDDNVKKTFKDGEVIPPPPATDNATPAIPLPTAPLEPYLLTKHNGPFMVMAYVFRTPNAAKYAQALAMELRSKYNLPAYVYFLKIHPSTSNIFGQPPTTHPADRTGHLAPPESLRSFDEAAVLVGDCKTMDEASKLRHHIKSIRPDCLEKVPSLFGYRKPSLAKSILTINPLVPAQYLYPGRPVPVPSGRGEAFDPSVMGANFEQLKKPDPIVQKLNTGKFSIYNCKGGYTMPVATFSGRATYDVNDPRYDDVKFLKKSPLAQAYENAEDLAAALSKCDSLRTAGFGVYTYHERGTSRVTVGSFQSATDPNADKLRAMMSSVVTELAVSRAKEKQAKNEKEANFFVPAPSPVLMRVPPK